MSQAASEAPIMGQRVAYRIVLLWNKQNSLIRVLVSKEQELFEEQGALSLTGRAHIDAFPLLMKDTSLLRFCTVATRFNCSFSEAGPL